MKIIALTSCPVGMAHTYMAAAALKKAAVKMGHSIRVETQGSMGIKDKITPEEVAEADLFIMSADVAMIEGERFDDIHTFETTTSRVIKKSGEVINEAIASLTGEDVVNEAVASTNTEKEGEKNGKKRMDFLETLESI